MSRAVSRTANLSSSDQLTPQQASSGIHILHVVGLVTDEVFSFLGPAARALVAHGHEQRIVAIDAPEHQHNVRQFDQIAVVVRVARARNPLRQWIAVLKACREELKRDGLAAVHVHGLIPYLLLCVGAGTAGDRSPLVYSPHGSRSLGTFKSVGRLAMLAARSASYRSRNSAIVNVPREVEAFENWEATDIIESPVADVFFESKRGEAPKPLIVTGGRQNNMRSVGIFSQLAVLLSGEELGLEFNWLGTVSPAAQQKLRAASVTVLPLADDAICAAAMASGWMYVAPWSTRGFPLFLVQAMAAGLPCVALDCELHRGVIVDGKTGFLCASEQEMVAKIASLVDNPTLRQEMGAAGKALAQSRFSESNFQDKLLTAYSTRW